MSVSSIYIAVIGSGMCDDKVRGLAYRVGRAIAERGAILVCGGLGGVMDGAAEGAQSASGLTIGILPEHNRLGASRHLSISIPTGMGEMRNGLIVRSADALIAVTGEYGTLSEIGFALKTGKPVIGLKTWELSRDGERDEGIIYAKTAEAAVEKAIKAVTG